MARTNNLTNFLTDVASAIKTKTGDSTAIPASQFDTKIANITTGHLDNTEYQEANDDLDDILEGSTPVTIFPPDWSQIGYENTPQSIIDGFNYAKNIYDNWDNTQTSLYYKYYNDSNLMYMPLVDTKNVTNMQQAFYSCQKLTVIPILDTENVTNMAQTFGNCNSLEFIPILDTKNVTNMTQTFAGCSKLTNESLNNILQMCINTTNAYSGFKTLQWLGITSAQATICQGLSNYQAFLNAGWTTGY